MQKLDSTVKKVNTEDIYKVYKKGGGQLTYKQYKDILSEFNREIMKEILLGYKWEAPFSLGIFKVIENPRKLKLSNNGKLIGSVDWGVSNKIKADIINRGGTPYKEWKDETGVSSNNGGEQWLVYHTKSVYYILHKVTNLLLKHDTLYKFDFTWHNQRAMQACIDEDSTFLYNRGKSVYKERLKFLTRIFGAAREVKYHENTLM